MTDYTVLIGNLRYWADACDRTNNGCQARLDLFKAADAIEQLVKERDAAVEQKKLKDFHIVKDFHIDCGRGCVHEKECGHMYTDCLKFSRLDFPCAK